MKEPIYPTILTGRFIDRPNRFVSHVEIDGKIETCHTPNPGRMRELLLPGTLVYVTPNKGLETRTTYRLIGVEKGDAILYLDTAKCNDVAAYLVNHGRIPGWEDYFVTRREVYVGDSRFDLLLCHKETGETFPVEVKSCSLSGRKGAMFPDAPTQRGTKHIRHLTAIAREGRHAGLLILVHDSRARWFLPDMHTDLAFAQAFGEAMDVVDWKAAQISWTPDFTMPEEVRFLPSSKKAIEEEAIDRGTYLLVLYVPKAVTVWGTAAVSVMPGYYVYACSADEDLGKKSTRYYRVRERPLDAMDRFRAVAERIGIFPIRSKESLDTPIREVLAGISDWDITIPTEEGGELLYGFTANPIHMKYFTDLEAYFQIDRLDKYFNDEK